MKELLFQLTKFYSDFNPGIDHQGEYAGTKSDLQKWVTNGDPVSCQG